MSALASVVIIGLLLLMAHLGVRDERKDGER